jgi:hypothetical protein
MAALSRLPAEWAAVLAARGEPRYAAVRFFLWLHARGISTGRHDRPRASAAYALARTGPSSRVASKASPFT